jgi:hypothetical protein
LLIIQKHAEDRELSERFKTISEELILKNRTQPEEAQNSHVMGALRDSKSALDERACLERNRQSRGMKPDPFRDSINSEIHSMLLEELTADVTDGRGACQ